MTTETAWLRKQPRQQRAIDRVEALLDTAAVVFHELGYEKATTNHIAERAGIPVGTLYRWFPDKAALAEGLAARYLNELTATYADLLTSAPPQTELIRTAIRDVAELVRENPAVPELVSVAATSDTGGVFRATLQEAIAMTIRVVVPTVADDDAERISRMITTVTFAVLGDALRLDDAGYEHEVEEFSSLVMAWMIARFPPADYPVWQEDDPLITPLAPSPGEPPRDRPTDTSDPRPATPEP